MKSKVDEMLDKLYEDYAWSIPAQDAIQDVTDQFPQSEWIEEIGKAGVHCKECGRVNKESPFDFNENRFCPRCGSMMFGVTRI